MSALFEITAFLAIFDDRDFFGPAFAHDLSGDSRVGNKRRPRRKSRTVVNKHDFIKNDFTILRCGDFFNIQNRAVFNDILLPARLDDRDLCHRCGNIANLLVQRKGGPRKLLGFEVNRCARYPQYILIDLPQLFSAGVEMIDRR